MTPMNAMNPNALTEGYGTGSSGLGERRWYVARTEIGQEFASARNLLALRVEVYCPTVAVSGARTPKADDDAFSGRLPMIRRYVFLRATPAEMPKAAHARGVMRLMGHPHPVPVTDTAIADVRKTEAEQAEFAATLAERQRPGWMPEIGQRIKVISGSYVGEWGLVIGCDADKGIVHLLVHIFAALRPAWITVEALDRDTAHFEDDAVVSARRPYLKRDGRQKATG